MSTNIEDVRRHLLDTLADLRSKTNPMDPKRANAIAQVAAVIVDSAKVEVDYIRNTKARGTEFFGELPETKQISSGTVTHTPTGRIHQMGE